MIAGVDHAAGCVENEFALAMSLEFSKDLPEHDDLCRQITRFALGVSSAVGPAHPRGHAPDAGVAFPGEMGPQALLDAVVAADGRTARLG